jgi:hypothetical protein
METVRIELEGDYAILKKEMVHKTTRAIDAVLAKHNVTRQVLVKRIQEAQEKGEIPADLLPLTNENDEAILLNQVTEWSFGAVSQEVLDNIPRDKYVKLTAEVDKLYSAPPLAPKS